MNELDDRPPDSPVKRSVWKKLLIPGTILLLNLLVIWDLGFFWPVSSISGNIAARWDTSHGRYEVLGYGLPAPSRLEFEIRLQERYGIRFRAVAGCIVSRQVHDYTVAYNRVSRDRIRKKFGRDVVRETADEAFRDWRQVPSAAAK